MSLLTNAHLKEAGTSGTPVQGHAGSVGAVGIVAFEFLSGNITSTSSSSSLTAPPFTDITSAMAFNLIQGPTPLGMLTGDTDAITKASFVYLVGRNEDSGTRIDTFAVSGAGLTPSGVSQFQPTFDVSTKTDSAGNATGALGSTINGGDAFAPEALFTEPNITWNAAGHSGYVAGGDVANVLSAKNPVTGYTPANAPTQGQGVTGSKSYIVG